MRNTKSHIYPEGWLKEFNREYKRTIHESEGIFKITGYEAAMKSPEGNPKEGNMSHFERGKIIRTATGLIEKVENNKETNNLTIVTKKPFLRIFSKKLRGIASIPKELSEKEIILGRNVCYTETHYWQHESIGWNDRSLIKYDYEIKILDGPDKGKTFKWEVERR